MSVEDSWWDESVGDIMGTSCKRKMATDTTKKYAIDTKHVVTRYILDTENNETLPSLHTKSGRKTAILQYILS